MRKFESKEEKVLAIGSFILACVWGSFLLNHGAPLWFAIVAGAVVAISAQVGPKWAANHLLKKVEARAWARAQLVMGAMAPYYDSIERRKAGYAAYRNELSGVIKDASINQWWEERWSS